MRRKWKSWLLLAAPYLLCALLPVISVLFLEKTVLTNYQNQMISEHQSNLQSAFNGMTQKIDSVENLSSMLSTNELVKQYSFSCLNHFGHIAIDRMALQKLFSSAKTNSLIYDVYLYDSLDDIIVSSESAVSSRAVFYRFNYVLEDLTVAERVNRLSELPRENRYSPAFNLRLPGDGFYEKEILEFRLFLPVGFVRENQPQLVVALDAGELFREFRSNLDGDDEFYVYDETGSLIYSVGSRYEDVLPANKSISLQSVDTEDDSVYGAVLRSRDGKWTIKVYMPNLLVSGMSDLSPAFLMFVILPMFACVLLTIAFTHKNYRGILELANLFRSHTDEHPQEPEIVDYRLVQKYAGQIIAEKDNMTKQITQYSDSRKYQVLDKLIRNTYPSREEAAKALAETGLAIRDGWNAVLCVCCSEVSYDMVVSGGVTVRQTVRQLIDNLLEQPYVVFDTAPNESTCVISLEEGDDLEFLIRTLASRINVELVYPYGIEMHIGMGNPVASVFALHSSYAQARQVIHYSEAYGNRIALYAELTRLEDVYYYPREYDEMISDYVVAGKKEEAKRIIWQVFEENFEKNTRILSAKAIEKLRGRLWDNVASLAEKYGISREQLSGGCMESGGDPSKKESGVKAFFDGLIQAVDFLDEVVQVRRSKTQSKSAEKILEYVTENLCDNTLSLSQISDALGLHRSYLSNIFKAAYGETLSSYIEQLRIEKASDMIKNTDMKIWDIAEAVGYTSDTSFRRAFKRITGFTPGEYREQD